MVKQQLKKNRFRLFWQLIAIHLVLGLIHNIANDLGHPMFGYFSQYSVWIQALAVTVYALVAYAIAGYVVVVAKQDKRMFFMTVGWALTLFTLVMMVIFAVSLGLLYWRDQRNVMLIYSILNPLFGTYMYRLPNEQIFTLWWLTSAIVPSIGFYIGTILRLKHEEYRL